MARNCRQIGDINEGSAQSGENVRRLEPSSGDRKAQHDFRRSKMFNLRGFENDQELYQFMDLFASRAFQHDLAAVASLTGNHVTNFGSVVARYLPRFQSPKAAARRLNDWMLAARDTGRNLFNTVEFWADDAKLAARFQFSQVVRDTHAEYLRIAGRHNLSRADLDRNWLDLVDIGLDTRAAEVAQNGSTRWEVQRKQRNVTRLTERLQEQGFSQQEIDQLRDMLSRQAAVYDGALGVAQVNRVDLEALRGRYNPRFYTAEMRDIMLKHKLDEMGLSPNNTRYFQANSDRLVSRQTFEWGVNDELLLADAVGMRVGQTPGRKLVREMEQLGKKYEDALKKFADRPAGRTDAQHAAMQRRLDELSDQLGEAERRVLEARVDAHAALQEHLLDDNTLSWDFVQMNAETLDRLVDNGVVGKMPLPTTRVLDILVERYKLPDFIRQDVGRAVVTDPVKSFEMYRDSLREVMGDSMLINEIHVNAVNAGFGVPEAVFRANPGEYPGHRPMKTLIDKYSIPTTNKAAQGVYLNEYAFDQLDAILNLSTEPAATNQLARIWQQFTSYWKTGILASAEYVFRNSFETILQGWRAGTNLAYVAPAMQYYRDFLRHGPDALPTDKRFGNGQYSVRDIFESLVQTGEVEMVSPMTNFQVGVGVAGNREYERLRAMAGYSTLPTAGRALGNRAQYLSYQLRHGQLMGAVGTATKSVVDAQRGIFSAVTAPLAFFTDSVRVANVLSTMDNSRWGRVGQFATGNMRSYTNINDAKRHLNEYIFRYDRGGLLDQRMRQVIPFWNYFSTSMPASLRNMVENPGQHMAYQRLYAAVNGDAREDEDFNEASTSPWFGNQMPIVFRDPNGRENMWFSVDMSRLDPHMDLLRRLSQASDNVARARGRQVGRFDQQLRDMVGANDAEFFRNILGQFNNPITQLFTAAVTQSDPFTGYKFQDTDTFLGLEVPRVGTLSGGMLKYIVSIAVPQLNYIDRTLRNQGFINSRNSDDTENPRTYINAAGEVDVRPELQSAYIRALSATGFSPQLIEGARNIQRSEASLSYTSRELKQKAGSTLRQAREEQDPVRQDELLQEVARQRAVAAHIDAVVDLLQSELDERGLPTNAERREMISEESSERVDEILDDEDADESPDRSNVRLGAIQ